MYVLPTHHVHIYVYVCIYTYIYLCVCVCACVCIRVLYITCVNFAHLAHYKHFFSHCDLAFPTHRSRGPRWLPRGLDRCCPVREGHVCELHRGCPDVEGGPRSSEIIWGEVGQCGLDGWAASFARNFGLHQFQARCGCLHSFPRDGDGWHINGCESHRREPRHFQHYSVSVGIQCGASHLCGRAVRSSGRIWGGLCQDHRGLRGTIHEQRPQ